MERTVIKGLSTSHRCFSLASIIFLLTMVKVNSMIAAANKTIDAFSAHLVKDDKELEANLVRAQGHLTYLRELHEDFHAKIKQFGPKIPAKYFDDHELAIRVRCLGDGSDVNDCGRWFVKVNTFSLLHQAIHNMRVKCTRSDHEGRYCSRGFLIGDVSDNHLQDFLDLRDQMSIAFASIESLCPKTKRSRKSYATAPVPGRLSVSQKNVNLSSSSVGSTQRKGSRKKNANVNDDRLTIMIKVWLKGRDFDSFLNDDTDCIFSQERVAWTSWHPFLPMNRVEPFSLPLMIHLSRTPSEVSQLKDSMAHIGSRSTTRPHSLWDQGILY